MRTGLRTPRSSRRDAARTITRSPHAAHPEHCPARSALPRERVRSVAQSGRKPKDRFGVRSGPLWHSSVPSLTQSGSLRELAVMHTVRTAGHCQVLTYTQQRWLACLRCPSSVSAFRRCPTYEAEPDPPIQYPRRQPHAGRPATSVSGGRVSDGRPCREGLPPRKELW